MYEKTRFVLKADIFDECQKLGTYKFVSEKECPYNNLRIKVSHFNIRHREGWKFKCMKAESGTYVILVDKGEFTLEGKLILNIRMKIFEGSFIKKWPRSRNRPSHTK